jgi:predicted RNA binding protein with dsRBD fold (UPF0201 family)
MKLSISTPLNPTENKKKIIEKMHEAFPGCKFSVTKDKISCETEDASVLEKLKQKIEEKRIIHTVQYLILKNQMQNRTKIELNKQTLMLGKFHFVEEDYPLGNIIIETDSSAELLKFLTGLEMSQSNVLTKRISKTI